MQPFPGVHNPKPQGCCLQIPWETPVSQASGIISTVNSVTFPPTDLHLPIQPTSKEKKRNPRPDCTPTKAQTHQAHQHHKRREQTKHNNKAKGHSAVNITDTNYSSQRTIPKELERRRVAKPPNTHRKDMPIYMSNYSEIMLAKQHIKSPPGHTHPVAPHRRQTITEGGKRKKKMK